MWRPNEPMVLGNRRNVRREGGGAPNCECPGSGGDRGHSPFVAQLSATRAEIAQRSAPRATRTGPYDKEMNQPPTTFPYPLTELDLSAPFERYRARVIAEWVDGNGHMNMAYYMVAFDKASDVLLEQLGLSSAYTERKLGMLFVL